MIKAISVSEFVANLKQVIDSDESFQNVALVGELSNFNAHRSGHFYFTLKDKNARIACVMFKFRSSSVIFKPKDGDQVIIVGKLSVFESSGTVQIYADKMMLDGLGDLHVQFERLKKEYLDKGYFNQDHKMAFPNYPQSIAVITGPNSAAYADIHRTLSERWPFAKVFDFLSAVQGIESAPMLVTQINEANKANVDLIILGRGGGSIEDLWSFNDPRVIEAVFSSKVPIVSGVGHESDTTLVDFVSDYRAATPTAAAVHVTPDQVELKKDLQKYKNKIYLSMIQHYRTEKERLDTTLKSSYIGNPLEYINLKIQKLDYLQNRITYHINRFDTYKKDMHQFELRTKMILLNRLDIEKRQLTQLDQRLVDGLLGSLNLKKKAYIDIIKLLNVLSPLQLMSRGYTLSYKDGNLIKTVNDIEINDLLEIKYKDGSVLTRVEKRIKNEK